MNLVVILEEDTPKQLITSNRYLSGLTAPTNESKTTAIVWSDPSNMGAAPSGLGQMYDEGERFERHEQIQLQPSGENQIDLSAYWGTVEPGEASAPDATMGEEDRLVTTVGHAATHFLSGSFTQPAVSSDVTVNMIDASPFTNVDEGTRILVDGCLYTLQSGSTFTAPGTLVLRNLGLGGARLALTA